MTERTGPGDTTSVDGRVRDAADDLGHDAGPPDQVVDVEVDREHAVRVSFADGLEATYPLLALRRACPCAGCRGARDQGREAYTGSSITVLDAELHGAWAISLHWSDGHRTGMYAWNYLRRLHELGDPDLAADPD